MYNSLWLFRDDFTTMHWNRNIVMTFLSSWAGHQVVILTIFGSTNDENVDIFVSVC